MPADKPGHANALLHNISQQLDDSVESLDAHTLSKLNQARQRALEMHSHQHRNWLATGAFAAIVLAITIGWLYNTVTPNSSTQNSTILLSKDDVELIDDLEFVGWLIDQDDAS